MLGTRSRDSLMLNDNRLTCFLRAGAPLLADLMDGMTWAQRGRKHSQPHICEFETLSQAECIPPDPCFKGLQLQDNHFPAQPAPCHYRTVNISSSWMIWPSPAARHRAPVTTPYCSSAGPPFLTFCFLTLKAHAHPFHTPAGRYPAACRGNTGAWRMPGVVCNFPNWYSR